MSLKNDLQQLYEENKNKPIAWVLIGIAVLMLVGALWPLFIIVPGAFLIYTANKGGKNSVGLIFPGVIVAGTGLILLYQSMSGHWASWAYIWTLYPVMVGYALRYHGERMGRRAEIMTGTNMMRFGLMGFAALALFFELLVFGSLSAWLLLAAGVGLLWWRGSIKLGNPEQDAAYRQKVRHFVQEKRKNAETSFDSRNEKRKNDNGANEIDEAAVSEELRQRINEVINEVRHVADDIVQRFDRDLNGEAVSEVEVVVESPDNESTEDEEDNQPVTE